MLELKNISVDISDENGINKRIVDDISLSIADNSFTAITGPNGGGKSTLAKVIMGILEPSEGQVLFNGKDITKASIKERADMGLSFAFQQPVRFKGITVADLLTLAAGEEVERPTLCRYLTEVGLCAMDYIDRQVDDSLSGGEMKRIEIASLIARNTQLSLFDEPEAGIDLWSFNSLITVFKHLQENHGGSILIISHQERILEIADEIIVLSEGKLSARGSSEEILPHLLHGDNICEFCPLTAAAKGGSRA